MDQQPDTCVAKVCGADVELGNFVLGAQCSGGTGPVASKALLRQISGIPQNALTQAYDYHTQDWGRKFLACNGGCAYIDLGHLELCVPEVLSAYDYVAAWHAMLLLARQAMDAADAQARGDLRFQVLVNNSDGLDHSYGGHLNFLLSRLAWDNIFLRKPHYLAYLASYQVSSIVLTGQGKVGSENGAPPVDYQLTQRADFDMAVTGLQTTFDRPIVNSRDEALCGASGARTSNHGSKEKLARMHCIFYDSNLCHVANLLKCGMMQIVLAMLEMQRIDPALIVEDPLKALGSFGHDPTLQARTRMASGRRLSAVELQLLFLERAEELHAQGAFEEVVPRAGEILSLCADTLQKLKNGDLEAVSGRLDWILKLQIIRQVMANRPQLTWQSPEIKRLDHMYSSLDADGLYWACEKTGSVESVVTPGEIERFLHEPPEDTRAYTRAMLLRLAGPDQLSHIDWDSIRFRVPGPSGWPRLRTLDLPDPRGMTKAETEHWFQGDRTLEEVLDALTDKGTEESQREHSPSASVQDQDEKEPLLLAAPELTAVEERCDHRAAEADTTLSPLLNQEEGQDNAIS